jgi:hypothetical protein
MRSFIPCTPRQTELEVPSNVSKTQKDQKLLSNVRGLFKADGAQLFTQAVPSPLPEAELTAQR